MPEILPRLPSSNRHLDYASQKQTGSRHKMDDREKRQVGEQVEPGGRPKAPGRLELLQRFLNSWNHELPPDWDRLGTRHKAQAWLRQHRLVGPGTRISTPDAAQLRALQEASLSFVARSGEH